MQEWIEWWRLPVALWLLRCLRQKECEFQASLGHLEKSCFLSQSTVQWQIIYLSMHRAWVQLPVLLKKLNQNKIIVIKRTLKWQDVSQDEQPTARPDDLRLILGTCLGKGENCFLQVVLWSLHDCYGTCMWCAHMCSNAVMAISLLLVHTGSARCLCYHELSPFTMLSLSLWAEVPWNADKIVFL